MTFSMNAAHQIHELYWAFSHDIKLTILQ